MGVDIVDLQPLNIPALMFITGVPKMHFLQIGEFTSSSNVELIGLVFSKRTFIRHGLSERDVVGLSILLVEEANEDIRFGSREKLLAGLHRDDVSFGKVPWIGQRVMLPRIGDDAFR